MHDVHCPADAYFVIYDLLSTSYFLRPPPPSGVRLVVEGDDGVRTTWELSERQAQWLYSVLLGQPVRISSVAQYTAT
jgi:hypothetical protein